MVKVSSITPAQAEANEVEPVQRAADVAKRRPAVLGRGVPATAPEDPAGA